jgi:hypothetical protein
VIFDDVSKPSAIYGDTTFNNFKSTTAGKALNFEANHTQTITGTFTLTGTLGNLITVRSTVSGTQWKGDPQGLRSVAYVDVKDSNNINALMIGPANSANQGNNINWFPEPPPSPEIDHVTVDNNPILILLQVFVPLAEAGTGSGVDVNGWQQGFDAGFNSLSWQEGDWPYSKNLYNPGKYRTVAVLMEGKIVFGPYDDQGLQEDKATVILPGQRKIMEGEVGGKMFYFGFDLEKVEEVQEDDLRADVYLSGKYKTSVRSIDGVFDVTPYDDTQVYYQRVSIIKSGEIAIQIRDIR